PLERAGRKLDPLVLGQLAAKLGVILRPQHVPLAIHAVDEPVPPYPPLERSRVPAHCVPPSRRSKSWRMATSTSSCIGVPLFAAYTFSRWCRSLGTRTAISFQSSSILPPRSCCEHDSTQRNGA